MAANSSIEWTDATWQVTAGCTRVSPGCQGCYAEVMAGRLAAMAVADEQAGRDPGKKASYKLVVLNKPGTGRKGYGPKSGWNRKVVTLPDNLTIPMDWRRGRKIFVNSESDLFHEKVPFDFVDRVFAVMALCDRHTFQVLTKRPERMALYLDTMHARVSMGGGITVAAAKMKDSPLPKRTEMYFPLVFPNVHLGTSVENQETASIRLPRLCEVYSRGWTTFVSYEPALGPVDWERTALFGNQATAPHPCMHQIISGGESGHGARQAHPQWFRAARDFCMEHDVAFFHKQNGEWISKDQIATLDPEWGWKVRPEWQPATANAKWGAFTASGTWWRETTTWNGRQGDPRDDYEVTMYRVGKKAAGRLLDGVEHNGFPTPATPAEAKA